MAYLSHSERTSKDNHNCPSSEENEWLELGLGLGFSIAPKKQDDRQHQTNPNIAVPFPVSAAASSHLRVKQKPPGCSSSNSTTGLELGLSLGIDSETHEEDDDDDDDDDDEGGNYGQMALWRNQDGGDDYGDDDDDYDDMAWWWPCHMNSGSFNDWQVPVPNNSHHYIPRTRPHSGLWFTLHSYTNRDGEALPQIPKAYIRVKDENVTIFMVKKYLVRKLGLSNEAEVEISCMGQRLVHTQTLKQVRDSVWLPRFLESESTFHHYSLQTNSANNHLMSLYYGRRCAFN